MTDTRPVRRLIGVYDADGTVRGELAYWFGARLGRAHCSLCDITHGLVRVRPAWRARRAQLPVVFDTFHRDDQPPAVRAATGDRAPAVVAETAVGIIALLGPDEIESCDGSIDRLLDAVAGAVGARGLTLPER